MASLKVGHGYFDKKRKPYNYSILNAKVIGVTSSHHPVVSRMLANKGFLDLIKFREKIEKSIRGSDAGKWGILS